MPPSHPLVTASLRPLLLEDNPQKNDLITNSLPSVMPIPYPWHRLLAICLLTLLLWGSCPHPVLAQPPIPSIQPYWEDVIRRVTEFRLNNGLKFIVLERHQAPVVSFVTYANVGGVNEPNGQTGVAHYLEHLAFKGTTRIGTRDYAAEAPLLAALDRLFDQIQQAKAQQQTAALPPLQDRFQTLQAQAMDYVQQNQMGQIVQQAGGVGLNANTTVDATRYFYSFPANKLELWMSLESERFLEPVFREFFQEKAVILEERRTRSENAPLGQMIEAFLQTAYRVHPYRRPVIGYTQDIEQLTRPQVQRFFQQYYVPNNLAIAVVGDVNPTEVKRLAEIYFGRYPAKPVPPAVTVVEPPQTAPREVTLHLASQPWYLEGYHIPDSHDPDQVVYTLIEQLLNSGRSARLYKALVAEQQVALAAQGSSGFPGDKYPSLMLFSAQTAPGHTVEEVAVALQIELERLKTEPVSEQELRRVKTQVRASLLRRLDSNPGMAQLLLEYEIKTGSWRHVFRDLDRIAAVTPGDIQRVARSTFQVQNRTIGRLLPTDS
ncbi:M16 family metallopeptidase [Neosynechococcus sphagnicola]|uniref:M16 family metallopeptidase n=1 Tax=Neosynechococcus sphagnicola TaxID=1501145 RepID=UPI001EF9EF82|nr:pitrilysin family protein [Neosynechococcus sphagnicola]